MNLFSQLMIPHIRGNWSNPPRRRRHLMKTLVGWHHCFDAISEMMLFVDVSVRLPLLPILTPSYLLHPLTNSLVYQDLPSTNLLSAIPNAVLLWRLQSIREIVFSGFQLELYAPEERTLAYWYLARLFELELECCEKLEEGMSRRTCLLSFVCGL